MPQPPTFLSAPNPLRWLDPVRFVAAFFSRRGAGEPRDSFFYLQIRNWGLISFSASG